MPFSHHSHSGQFCFDHAKDRLEETIQTAIGQGMRMFGLSEHMRRQKIDFYPAEIEANHSEDVGIANEKAYIEEALRLREKYKSQINIPIGFEIDWIRPSSLDLINQSLSTYPYDYFIGSVHHVHTVPIDFDTAMYVRAREIAGGTDEKLFEDYFDSQLAMLKELRPLIVGHFDLIRLKSDDPERSFTQWPQVWQKILRNLDFIAEYGGILELNSASLRKGMSEPYPKAEICKEFVSRNGRFCFSDDSHGMGHIGLNYHRVLDFIEMVGIPEIHYLEYEPDSLTECPDPRFPNTRIKSMTMEDVKKDRFWKC
ncbi:histidinolphosphatase [Myotisia sp. PD_48]|nr:histidinolphosphatase [Myotisia sp. PD_48]